MATASAEIRRGLADVVVDTTAISTVEPDSNCLTYRGYPVQQLAESSSFEAVAYLIWHGELPTVGQLGEFTQTERTLRAVDAATRAVVDALPLDCHPMDLLRAAVCALGTADPDPRGRSVDTNRQRALRLMAKLPTLVALAHRRRRRQHPIEPDAALGYAANFFRMCFGRVPAPEIVRCFETSLILYAEHGFNASTFTARVVTSTLSDMYSAVTAAIGALKGELHGGANEAVMRTLLEIPSPQHAPIWLAQALAEGHKIMGFGHRVYKNGDSRVPTMARATAQLVKLEGAEELAQIADALETAMATTKGIYPNLDYPAGLAYYLMGFDIPLFTPIFVMSRITGWTAHIIEQLQSNTLIRPLSTYTGAARRNVAAPVDPPRD